jgi:hypothetical protein
LRALDQAFNALGQEYFKLEIEYRNSGRDDLAAISRERGRAFHAQHMEFKSALRSLKRSTPGCGEGNRRSGSRRAVRPSVDARDAGGCAGAGCGGSDADAHADAQSRCSPAGDEAIETPESQP